MTTDQPSEEQHPLRPPGLPEPLEPDSEGPPHALLVEHRMNASEAFQEAGYKVTYYSPAQLVSGQSSMHSLMPARL